MSETKVGDLVEFMGYADGQSLPDNSEALVVGETYRVEKILPAKDENDDPNYCLAVDNPNFDSACRVSKKNPKEILIDVFEDEFSAMEVPLAEEPDLLAEAEDILENTEIEDLQLDPVVEEEPPVTAPPQKKKTAVKKKKAPVKNAKSAADGGKPRVAKATKSKSSLKTKSAKVPAQVADTSVVDVTNPDLKNMIILTHGEADEKIKAMVDDSDDIVALARSQADAAALADYQLGGVLYHIKVSGKHKTIKSGMYAEIGGWDEFVKEEIGIEYRKAQYLIDIYAKFNKYNIDSSMFKVLGWTKASQISRVMNAENAQQLVDMAETSTVSELKESIKSTIAYDNSNRVAVKMMKFSFKLAEESGVAAREIIEQTMKTHGCDTESEAFDLIVTEWAQDHLHVGGA